MRRRSWVVVVVVSVSGLVAPALAGGRPAPVSIRDVQASQDTLDPGDACPNGHDALPDGSPCHQSDTEAEPSIAVDPHDDDSAVTVFQVGRGTQGGAAAEGFAVTRDGGRTWTQGLLPRGTVSTGGPFVGSSDPAVTWGADGVMVASADLLDIGNGPGTSEIGSWTSFDGGETWRGPSVVASQPVVFDVPQSGPASVLDRSWLTTDDGRAAGHHFGRVYATWMHVRGCLPFYCAAFAAYSDDHGATWKNGPLHYGWVVDPQTWGEATTWPLVLRNGDLAVVVAGDSPMGFLASLPSLLRMDVASGAGALGTGDPLVFSPPRPMTAQVSNPAQEVNGRLLSSADGFAIGVDQDPRTGRIYVAWGDQRFRTDVGVDDIALITSDDDGLTWTLPAKVDPGRSGDGLDRSRAMLAVDGRGWVWVAYRQQGMGAAPDGSQDSRTVDTLVQVSKDGGRTFSAPLRVNSVRSDLGFAVAQLSRPWLGDYDQLAAGHRRVYVARPEAFDLHVAGERPTLPPTYHHQRIFVAVLV